MKLSLNSAELERLELCSALLTAERRAGQMMSRQIFFCLQCRFGCVNLLANEASRSPFGRQES